MTAWIVLGLLGKGTLVLGAGLAAARALRGRSAAIRHGALVATTVAAAALPALTLALPGWNVPLFQAEDEAPATRGSADAGPIRPGSLSTQTPAERASAPSAHVHDGAAATQTAALDGLVRQAAVMTLPSRDGGEPWLAALLAAWAAGALCVLGRFALDVSRTRSLLREAVEAPDGIHARGGARVAERLGVRRPVQVLFSDRLTVPVTWGIIRPVVVLPLDAWEWAADRIRIVLLHEVAHVRRLDCLSWGIAVLASALWWFHPLQWACRRRLRVEQERACDDVVLLDGVGPTAYATILVEFARGLSRGEETGTARAAIAMARRSTLRDRVETILATGSRSLRLEPRTAGLLAVVAAAFLVPLAAVRVWGETAEARRTAELIAELSSPDPGAREAAAWGLGALGAEDASGPLIARLADPEPGVRGVAARALGKLGGPRAFAPIARLLGDPDPYVRELAILGLGEIGGQGIVPALVPLLSDPEMGVRSVAVSALVHVEGPDAARALVDAAANDPDAHTRGMAIGGLAKGAAERDIAVPALVMLLDDPDADIRESVTWALAELGDGRAVAGLVARLAVEPEPRVRNAIVQSLAGFEGEEGAVEGLLAGLRDDDPGVRTAAALALGGSDDPRVAAALVEGLRDPVHQVRLQSAWSLDEIEARR
jgi:HEAT repeat protein